MGCNETTATLASKYVHVLCFLVLLLALTCRTDLYASDEAKMSAAESPAYAMAEMDEQEEGRIFESCYGDQLSDTERELYDALCKAYIEEGKTEPAYCYFSKPFAFTSNTQADQNSELNEMIIAAVDAFQNDHPDVFWMGKMTLSLNLSKYLPLE